jgi:uncharacterized protein (TIRG00374 family)
VNAKIGRYIRWLLTGAIVVFLIVFARTIDWAAAWSSIRHASLSLLLLAVGVNFLSIVIKGIRWWMFLRAAGSPSLALSLRATIAGAGLNNVLVANGGDAARVVFVSRATGIPGSTVLATLALERLFDPVGFVILIVFGVVAYTLPPALERWRIPAEIALAIIAVLIGWFLYSARHAKHGDAAKAKAEEPNFWGRFKGFMIGFAVSTRSLSTGPRFFAALILSLASWACQVLTFKFAADAAHVPMSMAASIATLIAINLGLVIRATPGNVGFFQFVFALTAEPFGIGRNDAIAVSLLIQTLQIIPVTLVGVALAPEFILKRSRALKEAEELAHESEPGMLGSVPQEGEKLPVASRKS